MFSVFLITLKIQNYYIPIFQLKKGTIREIKWVPSNNKTCKTWNKVHSHVCCHEERCSFWLHPPCGPQSWWCPVTLIMLPVHTSNQIEREYIFNSLQRLVSWLWINRWIMIGTTLYIKYIKHIIHNAVHLINFIKLLFDSHLIYSYQDNAK